MLSTRHSYGSNWKETVPLTDSPIPVSLPVPLSADSCVVCHLKQADEGGTHPRESQLKSLPRQSISLESALLPQGLTNFVLFGNSLSLMMYKCMTQFCGFQHLDAGNLLKPILLITEMALDFCPNFLLAPLIGNFLYIGLSGEVLRSCYFTAISLFFQFFLFFYVV